MFAHLMPGNRDASSSFYRVAIMLCPINTICPRSLPIYINPALLLGHTVNCLGMKYGNIIRTCNVMFVKIALHI